MLNEIQYRHALDDIEDHINKHFRTFYRSRHTSWRRTGDRWDKLTTEQKLMIVELAEKTEQESIAMAMMRGEYHITVPRVGYYRYSFAKEYSYRYRKELSELSREERHKRIVEYHLANKPRFKIKNNAVGDGEKMHFKKDFAKGSSDIL